MAKRSAVAAPAAAIDDDLPWDKPKSDNETANLFDTGGQRGLEDDANDEPSELEDRLRASLAVADESDLPARPEDPTTEILEKKPVGDVLTDIALQGISGRMRKKPLPAHSNEWVVATYRRMAGLRDVTGDQGERAHFAMDCTLLKLSADRRGISVDDSVGEPAASSDYEIVDDLEGSANTGQDLAPEQISTENILGVHEKTGALTLGLIVEINLDEIEPDPAQARDEGADAGLAESIKANGFYTNRAIEIRVHPNQEASKTNAKYMIVDGERRYRGAKAAGLERIPATITDAAVDEGDRLVRQVVMNEGKRLKPMEEARTYKRIMLAKGWSIQQLADHLGKSKSTVSDRVAMADAPEAFQPWFEDGTLSAAAAPIVRKYAHLDPKVLAILVERAGDDYGFRDHTERGKTVPIEDVKNTLSRALSYTFPDIDEGFEYSGETFTVDKKVYAVDRQAYFDARNQQRRGEAQLEKPSARAVEKERKERESAQRRQEAEARKREREKRLRFAQAVAVVEKAPSAVDGAWALMLIDVVLGGIYEDYTFDLKVDDLQVFGVKAPTKKTSAGVDPIKLLREHAESLKGAARIRLLLQLIAFQPEKPWNKAEDRLLQAAAIAKVDLKKVKLPKDDDNGDQPASTKKSAKKGR